MALNKDRIFKAADSYIRKNRIDKAIAEYETWLKENPKDWNTIRIVGDLYARISRNDEAIKKYAQVADHYRKDGFNVRAIATHKMILRLDPQNEPAMRNLAELQAEEGLLMEAKSYYQTLVELYNKQGHKRLASEVFKKLAEIDPQDVKIRYKYADFLNKSGKPEEAAREYVGIADQFIGQGLVEEAIKILEQGRALQTNDPSLKIKLAQASSMQGNHSQAIKMLEEVRRSSSRDPAVLARLGEAYLAAGNTKDAQAVYQELSSAQPGNPENVLRLVDLHIAQSKLDIALEEIGPLVDDFVAASEGPKATELLQKILSKDPHHIKSLLKLAEIHTILKQDSGRLAAYDSLCEAYSRAGDYQKAVQVVEQLVELDPESSQHKDRLKFLKSKLAGGAPGPEPVPRSSPPPPARPAAAPPRAAPVPELKLDDDLPEFGSLGEDDLTEAVSASFGGELRLDEPLSPPPAAPAPIDLGDVVELTQEEEENIKEKLTEAEVFVRYGLVDKAVSQLVDVLESFRFHTETREKLIEIYRDQGMSREAGEQLLQLSHVYDRLGRDSDAGRARDEAITLNPALASEAARAAEFAIEEEPDLILAPETESDLGEVGIELDLPPVEEEVLTLSEPDTGAEDEISISLDESSVEEPEFEVSLDDEPAAAAGVPLSSEGPLEVDWGAAAGDLGAEQAIEFDVGDLEDEVSSADEEEIPVAVDDELPEEVDFATTGLSSDLSGDIAGSEDIELDLEASSPEIAFSIDEDDEAGAEELAAAAEALDEEFEVSLPDDEASDSASGDDDDEEFSVEIDSAQEIAVEIGDAAAESEETFAPSFGGTDAEVSDFEIDIPSSPEVEVDLASLSHAEEEEPDEAERPRRDTAARAAPPAPRAEPVRETPAAPVSKTGALAAELEEVDEYIALGLYEDARDNLRELLKQHPGNPGILSKIEELGFSSEQIQKEAREPARLLTPTPPAPTSPPPHAKAVPRAPAPVPAPSGSLELPIEDELSELEALVDVTEPEPVSVRAAASAKEEDFIDLATELSEEIFGTHSAVDEEEPEPEGPLTDPGLDQIFREFRKGVEKQLGAEDYDTRYNLGIAYKEMGLLDEAIAEFQLAAKDEVRSLECCSMLGLCFMEKGMPDIAIKWFSKGLAIPGRRAEEYHGLRYDLAQAFEAASQPERALELYMEIFRENIKFRDVQERVKELQAARK